MSYDRAASLDRVEQPATPKFMTADRGLVAWRRLDLTSVPSWSHIAARQRRAQLPPASRPLGSAAIPVLPPYWGDGGES